MFADVSLILCSQDFIISSPPLDQIKPLAQNHLFSDTHSAPNSYFLIGSPFSSRQVKDSLVGCPPPLPRDPSHPTLIFQTPHPFNLHHTAQPSAHRSHLGQFPQKPPPSCHYPPALNSRGMRLFRRRSRAPHNTHWPQHTVQHRHLHANGRHCGISTLVWAQLSLNRHDGLNWARSPPNSQLKPRGATHLQKTHLSLISYMAKGKCHVNIFRSYFIPK